VYIVTKQFAFEAAHKLPFLPKTHKCHRLHGHSYKVVVACQSWGLQAHNRPWVIDYADIGKAVKPLIKNIDHTNLNESIPELEGKTTAEMLAQWFYHKLKAKLPTIRHIELKETESTNVIYMP
jgi:6-pyruvoyltetrahydropterin/6-carboxytetrahydropterin synthase